MKNRSLELFNFAGVVVPGEQILVAKEKRDPNNGKLLGSSVSVGRRKDIAELTGLTGKEHKDELDLKVREREEWLKQQNHRISEEIRKDPNWVATHLSVTFNKKDEATVKLTYKEKGTTEFIKDSKVAAIYGISVEEAKAMRLKQEAEVKGIADRTVDVPSVPDKQPEDIEVPSEMLPADPAAALEEAFNRAADDSGGELDDTDEVLANTKADGTRA